MWINLLICFTFVISAVIAVDINDKLHVAVGKNSPQSLNEVDALVQEGADVHSLTVDGESALHLACIYGHPNKVQYLLDKGVDPNRRNIKHKSSLFMTPLSWCVYGGHYDAVNILINHSDIAINAVFLLENGSYVTALNIANNIGGENGKLISKLLVQHGGLTYEDLIVQQPLLHNNMEF